MAMVVPLPARRILALALAGALLAASLIGAGTAVAVTEIGANHGLDDTSKREAFAASGAASTSLSVPSLELTACKRLADCGEGRVYPPDTTHNFLRLQYNEGVDRELVIDLPRGYVGATDGTIAPLGDGPNIEAKPIKQGQYVRLTVKVSGPTTAVYGFSAAEAKMDFVRGEAQRSVANISGVSIVETSEWEYAPESALSQNASYALKTSDPDALLVERRTSDGGWAKVRYGSDSGPVYLLERENSQQILIMSTISDPPEVRFKKKSSSAAQVKSIGRELMQAPGRILDLLTGWL